MVNRDSNSTELLTRTPSSSPSRSVNYVFEYLYRDASNYKAWGAIALSGPFSGDEEQRIRERLESETYFVAEKVGIPSLSGALHELSGGPTADDHGWHEFHLLRQAAGEEAHQTAWGSVTELIERLSTTR